MLCLRVESDLLGQSYLHCNWLKYEEGQKFTILTPYLPNNAALNDQILQIIGTIYPSTFKHNIAVNDDVSKPDYDETCGGLFLSGWTVKRIKFTIWQLD